ncbi:hypothetical protein ACFW2D_30010 [Streptomyces sp. NPDC058914]|uniref:hypothetical protein n=1 Tax=Streptomyces sp. NPDC058914 TaxID=3346671 RepID=UPI0036890EC0
MTEKQGSLDLTKRDTEAVDADPRSAVGAVSEPEVTEAAESGVSEASVPGTDLAPEPAVASEPEPAVAVAVEAEPEPVPAVRPVPAVEPEPSGVAGSGEGDGGAETVGDRPKGRRTVLRAVLRWTAAVAVFAAVGASTAYGITRMERTDVPGLRTESDGRWAYPTLTKPPLPSGSPAPFARANDGNAHHADLRALLLPAPEGATADKALSGSDGWLATKDFLKEFEETSREQIQEKLVDAGLRHIAARGWTTQDGATTRIYLLRFGTAVVTEGVFSEDFTAYGSPLYPARGADVYERDEDFPVVPQSDDIDLAPYVESEPYGGEQVRLAYLSAGDVMAVIVQSRKGTMPAIPFQQTVVLQSQLLG